MSQVQVQVPVLQFQVPVPVEVLEMVLKYRSSTSTSTQYYNPGMYVCYVFVQKILNTQYRSVSGAAGRGF